MKGTGVFKEFKSFIARGNVMDLAVGVIIGGAFGLIVTSLVNDIVMPVVGVVFGGFDFSNYFLPLSDKVTAQTLAEARKQGAVFAYGNFLTVAINFVILAWIIFLMVKESTSCANSWNMMKNRANPHRHHRQTSCCSPKSAIC